MTYKVRDSWNYNEKLDRYDMTLRDVTYYFRIFQYGHKVDLSLHLDTELGEVNLTLDRGSTGVIASYSNYVARITLYTTPDIQEWISQITTYPERMYRQLRDTCIALHGFNSFNSEPWLNNPQ